MSTLTQTKTPGAGFSKARSNLADATIQQQERDAKEEQERVVKQTAIDLEAAKTEIKNLKAAAREAARREEELKDQCDKAEASLRAEQNAHAGTREALTTAENSAASWEKSTKEWQANAADRVGERDAANQAHQGCASNESSLNGKVAELQQELARQRAVLIFRLEYGGRDYTLNDNIREKARNSILYGKAVSISNDFFEGDPAPNERKRGLILAQHNGNYVKLEGYEGEWATL